MIEAGSIAVLGATGAVGSELLRLLGARGVTGDRIRALGSSGESNVACGDAVVPVEPVEEGSFRDVRLVFMAAGAEAARTWAPIAIAAGCDVIDTSPAYRLDPEVPLVIPEVNAAVLDRLKSAPRLVANPNCSTILLLMALTPLQQAFGCSRITVSTYQAVSGAGSAAMDTLRRQSREVLDGTPVTGGCFDEPCAFNVFSHESPVDQATGRNEEEQKMLQETRRIWETEVLVNATCVRVPVLRSHAESIHVELEHPATVEAVRTAISEFPGVALVDDRAHNNFPTSLKACEDDSVLVGRIRFAADATIDAQGRADRFQLLCSMDQLRKGAALNAIQLADLLAVD